MVDIYDIKYKIFELFFPTIYTIFVFLIIFIFVYFFVLKNFFNDEKNTKKEIIIKIDKIKEKIKYLEDNIEFLDRSVFYKEIDNLIRDILFKNTKNKKVYLMTLSEIKDMFWNEDFYLDFKRNYFILFDDKKDDNLTLRRDILENIKNKIYKKQKTI